jgi:exoribonuclease R
MYETNWAARRVDLFLLINQFARRAIPTKPKVRHGLAPTRSEYSCGRRIRDAVTTSMNDTPSRRIDLQAAAKQVMIENGFEPEFSPQVQQELEELKAYPAKVEPSLNIRDLRNLLWSSIDNDTSRDLDQAEVAERGCQMEKARSWWQLQTWILLFPEFRH